MRSELSLDVEMNDGTKILTVKNVHLPREQFSFNFVLMIDEDECN